MWSEGSPWLQMVALTMMALALSEDSIRLRARRNEVINALGLLPEHIREVPTCLWPLPLCHECLPSWLSMQLQPASTPCEPSQLMLHWSDIC